MEAFDAGYSAAFGDTETPQYGDARSLLTLPKVKEILGITDTASDAKLSYAMPVVTDLFEDYCLRGLAYDLEDREEHGLTKRIPLFRFPLEAVTEFMIDGVEQAIPAIDAARGFVLYGTERSGVARITYSGGFKQDFVPRDLADAYAKCCADFAGVAYASSGGSAGGTPLKSLSLGSGALAVQFDTAQAAASSYDTSDVPPLLAPYKYSLDRYRVKDYV